MVSANFSFSMRVLSWTYVNIWIPIRLMYLRTKIALRPATNAAREMLALLNMVWCFVPISMMMILAEIINGLSKEWLRLVCLGYEKSIGVEPGSFFEKNITLDVLDRDEEDEHIEATNDKNNEEEAVNELASTVADEEKTVNESKE